MTTPSRDNLGRAIWAGMAFVLVGGAILSFAEPPPVLALSAWAMLLMGALGIGAAIRRLSDWRPQGRESAAPQDKPKSKRQAAKDAAWLAKLNAPYHHDGSDRPVLAPARKGLVRRVVTLLGDEGVFAPEVPDPAMLFEGVADWDGPVTQAAVLGALAEANYWHPGFDPERCMANVVMHDSHAEQFEETLRRQIADLERLAGGALDIRDVAIDLTLRDGPGPHPPCTIGMTVNGEPVTLTYAPAGKYLSSHIHVALARALKAADCGKRLAWLWCDQGAWIACLADGAVERLNAGPGFDKAGFDGWDWIDASDPFAAGDTVLPGKG